MPPKVISEAVAHVTMEGVIGVKFTKACGCGTDLKVGTPLFLHSDLKAHVGWMHPDFDHVVFRDKEPTFPKGGWEPGYKTIKAAS